MSNIRSPDKNKISVDSLQYSPIILRESPVVVSPQRNLTGLPRVARDIAADIYNNIQHWNSLHIKGASLINEIAGLKSNCNKLYPGGLESSVNELVQIIEGLKIIKNGLATSAQQLTALIKLHKTPVPLFMSWSIEKMSETGKIISDAYDQEFKLKEYVVENISHLQDKDKIMCYAACWTHQPYITSDIDLHLESLLTETGHRRIC